jgi:AcrR family transcriptional regulator
MDRRDARKKRRQEQVREEILDAARRVLLSRGLPGLTLAAVARELQLTKAALYYYFASKEALVFELVYLDLASHAEAVGGAVANAASGAEAVEALIRASSAHYGHRMDDLRLAYLVPQIGTAAATRFDSDMLARIRPFNDRMYGVVADKIRQDQQAGRVARTIDGRRLAFLAHTSVLGMLTVEGLVEVTDEAALIHSREAMVDELVRIFTARLTEPG